VFSFVIKARMLIYTSYYTT